MDRDAARSVDAAEAECAMINARQGFGIEKLDRDLGGGLLPGTLTVVAGATGIGKTQLGLNWADAGAAAEGSRGVICDLTSRGDSQNHLSYARSQFSWELRALPLDAESLVRGRLGPGPGRSALTSTRSTGPAGG